MGKFSDQFKKESQAALKAAREVTRVATIELFSSAIVSSPVGAPELWKNPKPPKGYQAGTFRSNWNITLRNPSTRYSSTKVSSEQQKLQEVASKVTQSESKNYFLTNNSPYGERLENGWSTQAPVGIVAPNVSRVSALIPKIYEVALKKYGL